ncbi:hypothetical protein B0H13DRAFT_1870537 [Mycena leptocephala]|nr:hypothetical protein B0H13DRAFT_1870537 [Mycena leptocephala]
MVPRPICRWPSPPLRKRPTSEAYTEILALDFLAYGRKASILNCAVVGPDIALFRTNEGRDVASVEWMPNGGGACVELHDKSLEKQLVSVWLGVSRDASYRMMYAHGQPYVWVPRSLSICLYEWDPVSTADDVPQLLARIAKEDDVVTLQISLAAIQAGLLEIAMYTQCEEGWRGSNARQQKSLLTRFQFLSDPSRK